MHCRVRMWRPLLRNTLHRNRGLPVFVGRNHLDVCQLWRRIHAIVLPILPWFKFDKPSRSTRRIHFRHTGANYSPQGSHFRTQRCGKRFHASRPRRSAPVRTHETRRMVSMRCALRYCAMPNPREMANPPNCSRFASNHPPHAPPLFNHVLRNAFARVGPLHQRPQIMLAFSPGAGQ